jgi:hypothetical protein
MSGALKVAFENPYIIGIDHLHFQDFISSGEGENLYKGFIRIDGTPKPSYH